MSDRDPFSDDVLERLIASNQDYQRHHGHYIVALSERLLAARRENATLREALENIAAMHGDGPLGTHEGDLARASLSASPAAEEPKPCRCELTPDGRGADRDCATHGLPAEEQDA